MQQGDAVLGVACDMITCPRAAHKLSAACRRGPKHTGQMAIARTHDGREDGVCHDAPRLSEKAGQMVFHQAVQKGRLYRCDHTPEDGAHHGAAVQPVHWAPEAQRRGRCRGWQQGLNIQGVAVGAGVNGTSVVDVQV